SYCRDPPRDLWPMTPKRPRERFTVSDTFFLLNQVYGIMAEPLILVTGSTDGIGKATAAGLAAGGAEVILHGRDEKKVKRVQRELARMAADLTSRYSSLDVLVNDAGTYQKTRHVTPGGIEMTFAVNYLGPFLLTHLLLPLLRKSPGARIVTVASSAHEDVDRIDWENLPQERRYDPWGAYSL